MINLCYEAAKPLELTPFEFLDNIELLVNACDLDMGKEYVESMTEALTIGSSAEIPHCNLGEDLSKSMGETDIFINSESINW